MNYEKHFKTTEWTLQPYLKTHNPTGKIVAPTHRAHPISCCKTSLCHSSSTWSSWQRPRSTCRFAAVWQSRSQNRSQYEQMFQSITSTLYCVTCILAPSAIHSAPTICIQCLKFLQHLHYPSILTWANVMAPLFETAYRIEVITCPHLYSKKIRRPSTTMPS